MTWLKLTEYETGEPCLVEEESIVVVVPDTPIMDYHSARTRIETKHKTVVYVQESSREVVDLVGDDMDNDSD